MKQLDAHAHIWDLDRVAYPWLTPELGLLHRNHTAEQLEVKARAAGIDALILVQAANSTAETEYLLEQAERHALIAGVVGWVDLTDPTVAGRQLQDLRSHGSFVGVRHLLHDEPDPEYVNRPAVRASLRRVAQAGLPFDVPDAWPALIDPLIQLAQAIPELVVVLDHLGKPPRENPDAMKQWRRAIFSIAALPNVVAKVSGLQRANTDWTPSALRPVWEAALEAFGPDRLMWGSDWPMTEPYSDYGTARSITTQMLSGLNEREHAAVMGGTATKTYLLRDPSSANPVRSPGLPLTG